MCLYRSMTVRDMPDCKPFHQMQCASELRKLNAITVPYLHDQETPKQHIHLAHMQPTPMPPL